MLKATNEERGTVAALGALSRDLEERHQDAGQEYQFSSRCEDRLMTTNMYRQLAKTLSSWNPGMPYHCQSDRPTNPNSVPLDQTATFYDFVILNGSRFYSSHAVSSNRASLVEVNLVDPNSNQTFLRCGELLEIFRFDQGQRGSPVWLGQMRWFREWKGEHESVWDDL